MTDKEKQEELLKYRLTYLREITGKLVPALGTVLANDEVKDGYSRTRRSSGRAKKMMQWSMRISAYAEQLAARLKYH